MIAYFFGVEIIIVTVATSTVDVVLLYTCHTLTSAFTKQIM